MSVPYQQLTLEMIGGSSEILAWMRQFPEKRRPTAIDLLLKLRFVNQKGYIDWLKEKISAVGPGPCALYAVRKFPESITSYWNDVGEPPCKPAQSLGSEDLVQSVVANLMKIGDARYLDHPSLSALQIQRVRHIVLIEDSLGSGKRVSDFIDLFMKGNKKLASWWSYGLFHFYVIALVRSQAAEQRILQELPGSDHPCRKNRKSDKLHFVGEYHYHENVLKDRWGGNPTQIIDLCDSIRAVPPMLQRGFGGVMSNVVFYHSVPDNIPGLLWYQGEGWSPLFPGRAFPLWLSKLLATSSTRSFLGFRLPRFLSRSFWESVLTRRGRESSAIDENTLALLNAARRGLRSVSSIARSIGLDSRFVSKLIEQARSAGFLNPMNRLTEAGVDFLKKHGRARVSFDFDRSLYIPSKWCVGRGTVQPSGPIEVSRRLQTESEAGFPAEDGDAGQASLERTDARSAAPPLSVVNPNPSGSRMSDDAHGPLGER